MPSHLVPHTPGQPATGWSTGFDWNNPLNAGERARMAGELTFLAKVTKLARQIIDVVDSLDTVLGGVAAEDYVDRVNLPPFPLPAPLAPLKLPDLTVAFAISQALAEWSNTAEPYPQFDQETGDPIVNPPAQKPIDVLRRVAKSASG